MEILLANNPEFLTRTRWQAFSCTLMQHSSHFPAPSTSLCDVLNEKDAIFEA